MSTIAVSPGLTVPLLERRGPGEAGRVIEIRSTMPGDGGAVAVQADGDGRYLVGYAAVFNTWTTISSAAEGTFRERLKPGAFAKTIRDRAAAVKVLLEHGHDGRVGNRPLGTIVSLAEDEVGLAYRVKLFEEADYVRELLPAFGANTYGASFRFSAIREQFDPLPGKTTDNPRGIPERTLEEVRLFELGPCTFPAYPQATAALRDDVAVPAAEKVEISDALAAELAERRKYLLEIELADRARVLREIEKFNKRDAAPSARRTTGGRS